MEIVLRRVLRRESYRHIALNIVESEPPTLKERDKIHCGAILKVVSRGASGPDVICNWIIEEWEQDEFELSSQGSCCSLGKREIIARGMDLIYLHPCEGLFTVDDDELHVEQVNCFVYLCGTFNREAGCTDASNQIVYVVIDITINLTETWKSKSTSIVTKLLLFAHKTAAYRRWHVTQNCTRGQTATTPTFSILNFPSFASEGLCPQPTHKIEHCLQSAMCTLCSDKTGSFAIVTKNTSKNIHQ